MFIEKCISTIMSSIIFVESSLVGLPVRYVDAQQEPAQTPVVEIVEDIIIEEPILGTPVSEEIVEEPVVEDISEPIEQSEPPKSQPVTNSLELTEAEIDLIALVTMAEAEGEPEEGKRAVIDVILNRYESSRFSDTIEGVIYHKNAFECMWNGRVDRCYVRDDIRQLVVEELESRTYSNIHYFRMSHYHNFGVPVVQIGNHYFSTY
jgi:N-acetylmuramoyl-L-alanine amidase